MFHSFPLISLIIAIYPIPYLLYVQKVVTHFAGVGIYYVKNRGKALKNVSLGNISSKNFAGGAEASNPPMVGGMEQGGIL